MPGDITDNVSHFDVAPAKAQRRGGGGGGGGGGPMEMLSGRGISITSSQTRTLINS
jgi:hypothetical protein